MTHHNETPALAEGLDLGAIRRRLDEATPGPWQTRDFGYVFAEVTTPRAAESGYSGTPIVDTFMWQEHGAANQLFIAHAREDISVLLAALAAERERADALALIIERLRKTGGDPIDVVWQRWRSIFAETDTAGMLAAHDAEVWDEGAEHAVGYSIAPLYDNPYRSARITGETL